MSRHLLFVESNTTGTGMQALARTRTLGLTPVLLTSRPDRYRGLDEAAPRLIRCDTNERGALERHVGRFDRSQLAGITTTSEYYLDAVATLAAQLRLPGNPPRAVEVCRNKARTRRVLAAAGVAQPRFCVVDRPEAVAAATRAVGLPCVVKPLTDSGSEGVRLCPTDAEARAHATALLGTPENVRGQPSAGAVLVEEWLDGPEFSVEMFSSSGRAACVGVTEKTLGEPPHFTEVRHIFPADRPADDVRRIVGTVRQALAAVGVREGPTHTEVRTTSQGPAVVEVNARLAGGMIPELIRLSTGTDLVADQLRAAVGRAVEPPLSPVRFAGIHMITAGGSGVVTAVSGADAARAQPGVTEVAVSVRPGQAVRPAQNSADRLGHVIAVGPTRASTHDRLTRAANEIHLTVRR